MGFSYIELLIVGDSNKWVYSTTRITAIRSTKLHYNCSFHCSFTDKTHSLIQVYIRHFLILP